MSTIEEKAINFKVDAELYKLIKMKALELDITMKEYLIQLIKKDLEIGEKK